jgi:transcriptional regulator with XRE-family HTH domain
MSREKYLHDETSIGGRMHTYRKKKDFSTIELAQLIEISQGTLSGIENNVSAPRADTFQKIVLHTDLNVAWLLTGNGEMLIGSEKNTAEREPDTAHSLLDVILESQNPVLKRAIMANLEAFSGTVKTEERLENLEKQVAELTWIAQQQSRAATDRRQTTGIGPDGIERRSGEDRRRPHGSNNGGHN